MSGKSQYAAARPKRRGEHVEVPDFLKPAESSSKKPKFDQRNPSTLRDDDSDDEHDAYLEADEIGKGMGIKRNAINLEGIEEDSDDDNFDARADAKAKAATAASEDEEDDDMFADIGEKDGDEDDDLHRKGKKKKKDVRFLGVDEIEGQEDTSKSGGHVAVDFTGGAFTNTADQESSSESGDDEERDRMDSDMDEELGAGGKKKHAPKLDAFNMKSEREEGAFDESGNYVRKATDPNAVHDSWLEGLSKKDMKRAKDAQEKRDAQLRQRNIADDSVMTSDVLSNLISHLEKGETALEALQRLGKGKEKKKRPKWQKSKRKTDTTDEDRDDPSEDAAEKRRKEVIEAITEAADQLMTRGQTDIYEEERESLIRQYTRETGESWKEPSTTSGAGNGAQAVKQWEYRWSDARDGGERHGPYDGQTMLAWSDAGYFADGVEFRRVGASDWSRVVDFV